MRDQPICFIIGAPKAGTTSLFHYIGQHPEVAASKNKETRFFLDDSLYAKGNEFFYNKYFPGAIGTKILLEATPSYLANGNVVGPRIKSACGGKVRFIVILRNPVDRAWSNYLHRLRDFSETKTFEEAVEDDIAGVLENKPIFQRYYSGGLYFKFLHEWFKHFERDKFLILLYEEMDNPEEVLTKVFRFLDISTDERINTSERKNVASQPRLRWLSHLKSNPPRIVSKIFKLITPVHRRRTIRTKVNRLIEKPVSEKPTIHEDALIELIRLYKSGIEDLEALLNIDLKHWKSRR